MEPEAFLNSLTPVYDFIYNNESELAPLQYPLIFSRYTIPKFANELYSDNTNQYFTYSGLDNSIIVTRATENRYKNLTLKAYSGDSFKFYFQSGSGIADDDMYFSGPLTVSGVYNKLTRYTTKSGALANAVTFVAPSGNSNVYVLPDILNTTWMRLYHQSVDGTTPYRIYQFLPRTFIQVDDLEAEVIDAVTIRVSDSIVIGPNLIGDKTILGQKIVDGTLSGVLITNGTVTGSKIEARTISGVLITAGTIKGENIEAATISGVLITAGTIKGSNIEASTISGALITAGTITSTEIATSGIKAINLEANSITADKISSRVITAEKIVISGISADLMGAEAVTAAALASGAVVSGKVAANAIYGSNIVGGTITGYHVAANTITGDKIVANTISGSLITGGTITGDKIQVGTISGALITAGTITSSQIDTATILASNIKVGTITADRIATGTLTAAQIADATLTGAKIVTGTISGVLITDNAISATKIQANTITGDKIAAATISGALITANTITADNIAAATITGDKIVASTISGSLIAASTITSNKLNVSQLDAITANMGTLTVNSGISIGTNGYIWTGTGNPSTPVTGLKIYTSSGVSRLTTYSGGAVQVDIDSAGKLVAGATVLDNTGITIGTTASLLSSTQTLKIKNYSSEASPPGGIDFYDGNYSSSTPVSQIYGLLDAVRGPRISMIADVVTTSTDLRVAGSEYITGTLNVTGQTTAGALQANGAIGFGTSYNKFTIAAATGNTAIAGTLGVTGTTTLNGNFLQYNYGGLYKNTAQTVTAGADAKITFQVSYTNGTLDDVTNSRLTIANSGFYLLSAGVVSSNVVNNWQVVTGGAYGTGQLMNGVAQPDMRSYTSKLLYLSAGTNIELWVRNTGTVAMTVTTGANGTVLTIVKVG